VGLFNIRNVGSDFFFCSTQKLHQANLARFFFLRIPNLSRWTELTEMELRPVVYSLGWWTQANHPGEIQLVQATYRATANNRGNFTKNRPRNNRQASPSPSSPIPGSYLISIVQLSPHSAARCAPSASNTTRLQGRFPRPRPKTAASTDVWFFSPRPFFSFHPHPCSRWDVRARSFFSQIRPHATGVQISSFNPFL
jgi:hypothetical protein